MNGGTAIGMFVAAAMVLPGLVHGFQDPFRTAYRDFWIGEMIASPAGTTDPRAS